MVPDYAALLLLVNAAMPAILLGWDATQGRLGSNPQEFAIRTTGMLTLVCLMATLMVTPLRRLLKMPGLIRLRRMAGLFTFFYGCLHLLSYSWFDKELVPESIIADTLQRPFIFLGMAGFALMVPLAVTSTNRMVKRMGGQRWVRLHRAVYLTAIAGVIHYYLLVRADKRMPLAFAAALCLLLGYRVATQMRLRTR